MFLLLVHESLFLFPAKRSGGYGNVGRPSEICCKHSRFLFVDQLISNLHTSIILGISSLSSKLGKVRYLEDFRSGECDSDKCNLKMVANLAAIFNTCMVAKTHKKFRSAPITKKIDI